MEAYEASKSDIDFEFDSSDSENSDDISVATHSDASIESDTDHGQPLVLSTEKRTRVSSVDSDDFGPPIVVPLKTGSDHSADDDNEPIEPGSRSSRASRRSGSFSRRAPVRTKSGGGMNNSTHSAASGRRRPPRRTKSGEGLKNNSDEDGGESRLRRRPPPRTKSGEAGGLGRKPPPRTKSGGTLRGKSSHGEEEQGIEYSADLPPDDDSFDANSIPTSPALHDEEYRELALKRNSARRQRSSDTLGAMRDATRNINRSQSGAAGISNGRRRVTGRSKSSGVMGLNDVGEQLASPGRKPLRRKAPARTKSGGTVRSPPLET